MDNCIFCKIIGGTQEADIVYDDEEILIIKDIKPASKCHYLAIPKVHIKDVNALTSEHKELVHKLINLGKNVIEQNGGDINDTRLGFHVPPFNSIQHLHLHLISPVSEMSFMGKMIFRPNTWWFTTDEYVLNNMVNKL